MPASVEKTYSDALFTVLCDANAEKAAFVKTLAELEAADAAINAAPEFLKLLGTPTVSVTEKLGVVEKAFKEKVSPYVFNFLRVLTVKGRMAHFNRIYKTFREDFNEKFGVAEITVTSPFPLDGATRAKISARMQKITGKEITLKEKVDKTLIGGVTIDYGNTRFDGSVRTRLNELKNDITGIIA